ncbi:MAG: type II toxin-antitoxin system RelE/ParE family toxin [Bacteroidota bacterium]|nr:type II toxin-antitoxin system RelE/ParE family toxin [Bacteroidota bacterium]
MAYPIVWTSEAENDFKNIILYLKENWSQQSSEKFIERAYKRLEKLADMPSVARATSQHLISIYKLDKKNALFFTVEDNYLILLSIYPYKKDITKSKYY